MRSRSRRTWAPIGLVIVAGAMVLGLSGALRAAAPVSAAGDAQAAAKEAAKPVLVFLLRHAGKRSEEGNHDRALSEPGVRRAEALAEMLAAAKVTHLFATQYRRTQETLAPLAKRDGVAVEVIQSEQAEAQCERLRALPPGSIAVVAGHSNSIPALVQALGGTVDDLIDSPYGRILNNDAYDRLFLVVLPPGGCEAAAVQSLEMRYGA